MSWNYQMDRILNPFAWSRLNVVRGLGTHTPATFPPSFLPGTAANSARKREWVSWCKDGRAQGESIAKSRKDIRNSMEQTSNASQQGAFTTGSRDLFGSTTRYVRGWSDRKGGCVLWVPEKITFLQVCFLPPFSITTFSCYKMTVIHLFVWFLRGTFMAKPVNSALFGLVIYPPWN